MKLDNNVNSKTTLIGISPAKVIRGEPYYSSDELLTALPKVILNTPYFRPKAKEMTKDLELKNISTVNAMKYDYQAWAIVALSLPEHFSAEVKQYIFSLIDWTVDHLLEFIRGNI
jgi:hypothetical protein